MKPIIVTKLVGLVTRVIAKDAQGEIVLDDNGNVKTFTDISSKDEFSISILSVADGSDYTQYSDINLSKSIADKFGLNESVESTILSALESSIQTIFTKLLLVKDSRKSI